LNASRPLQCPTRCTADSNFLNVEYQRTTVKIFPTLLAAWLSKRLFINPASDWLQESLLTASSKSFPTFYLQFLHIDRFCSEMLDFPHFHQSTTTLSLWSGASILAGQLGACCTPYFCQKSTRHHIMCWVHTVLIHFPEWGFVCESWSIVPRGARAKVPESWARYQRPLIQLHRVRMLRAAKVVEGGQHDPGPGFSRSWPSTADVFCKTVQETGLSSN